MRSLKTVYCLLSLILVFAGCSTTGTGKGNAKNNFDVYLSNIETEERHDVYAISLQKGVTTGIYSHTLDRYEGSVSSLMRMEFGSFKIEDKNITFTPGKNEKKEPYTGMFTDNGLEVEGRVYKIQADK